MTNTLTANLRTLRIAATCSDGTIRWLQFGKGNMGSIIGLVTAIAERTDASVSSGALNATADKQIVMKPGVRMDDVVTNG